MLTAAADPLLAKAASIQTGLFGRIELDEAPGVGHSKEKIHARYLQNYGNLGQQILTGNLTGKSTSRRKLIKNTS